MAKNIFELNGKAYDALTGAYLGDAKRVAHTATVQSVKLQPVPANNNHAGHRQPTATKQTGNSMDGMMAAPQRSKHTPQHVAHHKQQPTKTLMRHAVKAPGSLKATQPAALASPVQPAVSALQPQATHKPQLQSKLSHQVVDPMRARRARDANRSQSVQHFRSAARPAGNPYVIQEMRRPMHNAAVSATAPAPAAMAAIPAASVTPLAAKPMTPPPAMSSWQTRRATVSSTTAAARPVANYQATATPVSVDDTAYEADLFEQALAHATSHEQVAPVGKGHGSKFGGGRRKRQLIGIAASLSVFLLLIGFIAFQNRTDIQLQIASAKAGFSAATPLEKPDGYNLSKLAYAPGSVATIYQHKNKQSFSITQKKSNWDSQTLLENFVATSNEDYKGYQSNGRTVYVYGKGNATWVNGGIWYQLKDNGGLRDEQLVRIAASM